MNEDTENLDFECRFSPEGRLPHVEYAIEATFNSETAIGMKGSDGFVLAVEKITTEPLLDTTVKRNIFEIDQHIGAVGSGLMADARRIANKARTLANDFRKTYGSQVPLIHLMQDVSEYMHENTLHSDRRPFAANLIFGSYLPDGPQLFSVRPSGDFEGYNYFAIGKAAEVAKSKMVEIDFPSTSVADLVWKAAKIIYMVHEDQNDFDLEISWCGEITNGIHEAIRPDLLESAKNYARGQRLMFTAPPEHWKYYAC